MSLTAQEVEEKISDFEDSPAYEEGDYHDWGSSIYEYIKGEGHYSSEGKPVSVEVPGLPTVEYADDYGGEGQGDDYWVVIKVGNQYFRKNGWYASYDGGELDGELEEVKPIEVKRTEWKSVDG